MNLRSLTHRAFVSGLVIALAACADSVTSPVANDGISSVSATAASKTKPQDDVDAQAIVDGHGVATVQVTTGSLAYFDDQNRQMVDAVPGTMKLKFVHVKFCKDSYKDFGLHQFSANFDYKDDAIDKEDDDEPDSPLDPDDKTHYQVNWDRSARRTTLDGSGDVSIPFTGIPIGASLELHVHYYKPTGKVDKYGKVEVKDTHAKFCIPVYQAPDVSLQSPFGGNQGSISTARTFGYWVAVTANNPPLPVTATCKAYIGSNPTPVAVSAPITVGGTLSQKCEFSIKFAVTGQQQLTFKLEDITPSDFNADNNVATRTVDVGEDAPPTGGGTIVFTLNPTIKETSKHFITNPTAAPGSTTTDIPAPTDVTEYGQDSKLIFTFQRLFTGPVTFRLTQKTAGRVIDVSEAVFPSSLGCQSQGGNQNTAPFGVQHTTAFSISVCRNLGQQTTTIEYDAFAKGTTTNGINRPTAGVFSSYNNTIEYTVEVLNTVTVAGVPRQWSWSFGLTTPIVYEYQNGTGVIDPKCNDTICFNQLTISDYSRIGSAFGTELPKVSVVAQQIN